MDLTFIKPVDGDVLFSRADGREEDGRLAVLVQLRGTEGQAVTVNGVKAREQNGVYTAEIKLDGYRSIIEAKSGRMQQTQAITVYWFKDGYKTYWLGVDDVIWCLENICRHSDTYSSIFDDPFLSIYRELHEAYGTKVHMHLFYETADGSFNLSMFPEKYKAEFIQNAGWLRFTFHSRCEFPDSPYKHASYEQVMREGRQVEKEIRRFASGAVLDNVTSQHWADSGLWETRAFRALGYRVLDGYFLFDSSGEPYVSYYLNKEQTAHAHSRDFWVDCGEGIIFVRDDIIINEVELDQIDGYMDAVYTGEDHSFMYLLIHEQYFYKDYPAYQPDYKQKIFKAVEWCARHSYRPVFLSDIAFEKPLSEDIAD